MAKEKTTSPAPTTAGTTDTPGTDNAPPTPPVTKPVAKDQVTVRVVGKQPIYEDRIYDPGATFVTTAKRAAALGKAVEIVTEK